MSDYEKRVLIVEDEKPLAHALELKLQHEGFSTEVVRSGHECLSILEGESFDVILLDLMLPGVDGFTILEKLHEMGKVPSVIILTNLGQAEDEARAIELGATRYFVKSNTPLSVIVDEVKRL